MVRNHPDSGVQAMQMGFLDHVEQRAQRTMLRELLEERFGPLPPAAVASLDAWPGARLMELGRALVTAESLEELGLGKSEASDS